MVKKAKKKSAARTRAAKKSAKTTAKASRSRTTRKKKRSTYSTTVGEVAAKYGIPLKPGVPADMKMGDFLIANGSPIAARLLEKP